MARIDTLGNFLTDVADAIREKTGKSDSITPADFDTEIESISGGGSSVEKSDVNFYDYDGTLLYAYDKNDFLALNEMPSNPSHNGLTAQGWNWNLTDAKTYVTNYEKLNIGQMYITDDGSTRIYIELKDGRLAPYLTLYVNGTVTIDWGDNSATNTITGSNTKIDTQHTYANEGKYVIVISPSNNSTFFFAGNNNYGSTILWNKMTTGYSSNRAYQNAIKRIELGEKITVINSDSFHDCYSLKTITIPNSVISIGARAFQNCYSLNSVTIPNNATWISSNVFQKCYNLNTIIIPNGVTNIDSYAFQNCYSLNSVTIPNSVNAISTYAFQSCYNLNTIIIPNGVTSLGINIFYYCYSLNSITISNSVNSIGKTAFWQCYSLSNLTIPSAITKIDAETFGYCSSVAYFDFTSLVSIPTLANTNAFTGIAVDCKIIVPDSLYEDWIAATNWSTYASYIIKESDYNA